MNMMQVNYGATGTSTAVDALGMRDMQARAYAKRRERYLLLKAPPASGKSRALMYLALDKLERQGLRKGIVAVGGWAEAPGGGGREAHSNVCAFMLQLIQYL